MARLIFSLRMLGLAIMTAHVAICGATYAQTPSPFFDQTPETVRSKISAALMCDWWASGAKTCTGPHSINVNVLKNGTLENVEFFAVRPFNSGEAQGIANASAEQIAVLDIFGALIPEWLEARSWLINAMHHTSDEKYEACIRVKDASVYVRYDPSGDRDEGWSYVVITPKNYIGDFKRTAWWEKNSAPDTCTDFSRDAQLR